MTSTTCEDLSGDFLVLETFNNFTKIFKNTQNLTRLHKELLETNLSIATYVQESKTRLEQLRLSFANNAKSSEEVIRILSTKCKNIMTHVSNMPLQKNTTTMDIIKIHEDNNNIVKSTERLHARSFISWFKRMIDNERDKICLYLTDDALFEWFGRTIRNRKKISHFLKYDMQCSRHNFTSIESIEKVISRHNRNPRNSTSDISVLSNPLSPEVIKTSIVSPNNRKRPGLRSFQNSPEWETGCGPEPERVPPKNGKKRKTTHIERKVTEVKNEDTNNKGDILGNKSKRKCLQITPPNQELGQGDCLPSTSGTDSELSHAALNAQLPRKAVECDGYIEFTRSKNNRASDAMKWERKCKLQISYSPDPLNVGEYIIWQIHYTDESKCRRNLLAAFEEVALQEGIKKVID